MGLFVSYCKKCNNYFHWFLSTKNGYLKCDICGTKNTEDELHKSMYDEHYWDNYRLMESRKNKINKIKNIIIIFPNRI